MAKSGHSHKHYHIGIIILIVFFALVSFKLLMSKAKWEYYVVQSQQQVMKYKMADSVEDAGMISSTIVSVPQGSPMLKNAAELQSYVDTVSRQTGRDVVVVDNKKKILADTFAANAGKAYGEDKDGEVAKTIADGQARTFIEKSADYPGGIEQNVISFKDHGTVAGAVIISNSKIF
jgi:sensor histidine kinase regulating citrate/malate metabolism